MNDVINRIYSLSVHAIGLPDLKYVFAALYIFFISLSPRLICISFPYPTHKALPHLNHHSPGPSKLCYVSSSQTLLPSPPLTRFTIYTHSHFTLTWLFPPWAVGSGSVRALWLGSGSYRPPCVSVSGSRWDQGRSGHSASTP